MITAQRKEALVAQINVRDHQLISGLSKKIGGQDEGLDPHELLESALAACTILTAQLYANRKGYKLDSTDVTIKILSEGEETIISLQAEFKGDLTIEERTRLAEIIEKCPIHRLLESNVEIQTTVL